MAKQTTEAKPAEARLKESEARYQSLFENVSDGILLLDDRETILSANPMILKLLGYRRNEIEGKKLVELLHPEDPLHLWSAIQQLPAGEMLAAACRLRHKNGGHTRFEQHASRIADTRILALFRVIATGPDDHQDIQEALQNAEDSETQLEDAISRVNTMAMEAEVASIEMDQIFNATSDGICVINKDFQVSKYNQLLRDMMAQMGQEMVKANCSQVLAHELCGTERCLMNRILKEDLDRIEEEIEVESTDGRKLTFIVTAQPLMDLTAETIGVVESFKDITDRKQIERELRRLAVTDPLTGAFNRREFMRRAQEEIERSKRYHTPLTLLMLDIDKFKAVNDTYGHDAGDEVLKSMVAGSLATLRASDIFCRLGGEEFGAILTHTAPEEGFLAAERLRKAMKALVVKIPRGVVRFTVSIGLASMVQADLSLEGIMKRADDALYEAKQQGRDRVIKAS
ncbi:MAG: diguanylate cyclase [Desulfobacterales bacterium]|jgi:diguanylate cyclase (GGDEF)-like protein/PAS domain S-box-containing protein